MHFTCEVSAMANGLSLVTRAIAARSAMQILEGVLLSTCEDGLRMTCTDLALGIETHIPAEIAEEGAVVLPGKLFAEIVRKLPPEARMELRLSETGAAAIRCSGSRTTLSGMAADEYPALPDVGEATELSMPQNALREMIQKTTFAISTDESRPILTGCLLETEDNVLRCVALDGFRLARLERGFDEPLPSISAVVPGKVLNELAKALGDDDAPVTFALGKSHLMADTGATRFVARLLDGEFIKYKQILPVDWLTRVRVNKSEMQTAIDRASLMAREGKNNLVRLHIGEGKMLITSNSELGDVREEIEAFIEGRELDIAFNVRYLSDTLRVIDDEEILIRFNSNVSPCLFCPLEGNAYVYLALPVRVFTA